MIDEKQSLNPIDYFLNTFLISYIKNHKEEKQIVTLNASDYNKLIFNKRNELLLYKNSIGDQFNMGILGGMYFFSLGLLTSTYIKFRFNKMNNLYKSILFGFNIIFYLESYYSYKRLKDIRSIYLQLPDTIIVKTKDSMKYNIAVNDIINITVSDGQLYTFFSKGIYEKSNKYLFFMIQNPKIKTTYISPLFNHVMGECKGINLI